MATDYSKRKNVELEELLRARSLPHTGKKADLIARLVQHDKDHPQPQTTTSAKSSATAVADEEIDWDDDGTGVAKESSDAATLPRPAPEPTPAAAAAVDAGEATNQIAVKDITKTTNPAVKQLSTTTAADDQRAGVSSTDASTTAPAIEFAQALPSSSVDDELEKRRKRAERFGLPVGGDSDAVKALERAKKFGTGPKDEKAVVTALDSALPERVRKRGRDKVERVDGEKEGEQEGKRQDSRRREGRGRGQGKGAQAGSPPMAEKTPKARPAGAAAQGKRAVSEKDKLAAEARKKRFATAC